MMFTASHSSLYFPACNGIVHVVLGIALASAGHACAQEKRGIDTVVISASRVEQKRFDAPASIDAVEVDAMHRASPLVNMSELLSAVPGIQTRERQNYAQDLQLSVRGFGTRSTFGVRGVRILIDGIPATMPDGQGQAATASLNSAKRIEVLRGPVAQLYGNAAGGVLQIFTNDPPLAPAAPYGVASAGVGGDGQRQAAVMLAGGAQHLGGLLDVSHFETGGYREHSAARRMQFNGKLLWQPSAATKITGVLNGFDQPLAQDPLGLTHAQFEQDPRQVVPAALVFDTRKRIRQQQGGFVAEHKLNAQDTLNARVYAGTRQVLQTLALSGSAANSAGGVVDLDNRYQGAALSWSHATRVNDRPLNWTVGIDADTLDQVRKGYVNNNGSSGDLRRDELDRAANLDLFGQLDWAFAENWKASAGVRSTRVRLAVDDRYVTAASPNDSGSVEYRNTSPVLGLVWHASDALNVYGNLGGGFETPTLTEIAYRAGATGPNLALRPSRSVQGELGIKWRGERQTIDAAVFTARSSDEIVPLTTESGRSIYQNVDSVTRRGIEASWKREGDRFGLQLGYTLLDASFGSAFVGGQNAAVASGSRLPGAPRHSLFTQFEIRPVQGATLALEMRTESRTPVDDVNSDFAPGYAVFHVRGGQELRLAGTKMYLYGRIDNLFDRNYAGSVIVNDGNRRFFEPAAGRRLFIGVRVAI
jgi:iron complex outermembrane recepter protein